ncbi:MAG: Uma2 family endonuclease [Ferruginibacter sp.]|nr:Uma2 family endonuclease [Ferruginibacter sp.]
MSIAEKYRPHYTYEDYCQWEGKWELIEGMPYAMSPAPAPAHQSANANLYVAFKEALKNGCKKSKAYIPIDWKINEDTVVQPDLLIVCDKVEKKFLDFPPELVVEVLSPSTAAKDRGLKKEIYQLQKVKYYLIADPQFKKLEIYQLTNDRYEPVSINPENYIFTLADECIAEVSFSDIWD